MPGQKFQYDESGSTFVYFLLSFLALILIPSTYYCFIKKKKEQKPERLCLCPQCQVKQAKLDKKDPGVAVKKILIKLAIIAGWVLFVYVAYKTTQYDYEYANFDPYEILQVEIGASQTAIKSAYRKLSLIYHPDKPTGDEKSFMKITKAYQALTDETARRNWEMYGNPDGPGAVSFGIALPSWIVEKENSIWVLGLYALLFMVALPVTVGTWWYRSIRYSGDQVLLDTTQMYYYFFHKTPQMAIKRVIMILAASAEFHRRNNQEIQERFTDEKEVPQLMRQLPQLNEKNKERPLCFPYSIKARSLLHAHMTRLDLPGATLEEDRQAVIKKCPPLIQEMVVCVSQLIMLAHSGRLSRMPSLSTLEGCMKLSAMVVQALWEFKSPLMQLPHITDDNLKYFSSKRHQVRTLEQLARLKEEDRRAVLHHLSDDQYSNLVRVLGAMPYVQMNIKYEVVDDEATTQFTAGAIVTVTVALTRKNLSVLFEDENGSANSLTDNGEVPAVEEEDKGETKKKALPWHKNVKKGKKSSAKKTSAGSKKSSTTTKKDGEEKKAPGTPGKLDSKHKEEEPESGSEEEDDDDADGDESEEQAAEVDEKSGSEPENEDQLAKLQNDVAMRRQRLLEGKSQISHSVHCPYFPLDKQEYWWVYITDRKNQLLLTAPYYVTNLVEFEEVQLKFTAPFKPGVYTFAVCLRSDSYFGFDQMKDIRMDVKEAPEVPKDHPQWDISDDEEEDNKSSAGSESEFATDDDDEEDKD